MNPYKYITSIIGIDQSSQEKIGRQANYIVTLYLKFYCIVFLSIDFLSALTMLKIHNFNTLPKKRNDYLAIFWERISLSI